MQHLKDMPPGAIWPHLLEAIERDVMADIRQYAQSRANDVARGAETPELAALLVDKYCEGMAKALYIAGFDSAVRAEGDRLAREIDPEFDAHREARWAARPASLTAACKVDASDSALMFKALAQLELTTHGSSKLHKELLERSLGK